MKHMQLAVLFLSLAAGRASAQTTIWVDPAAIVDETLVAGSMVAVTVGCDGLVEVRGIRILVTWNPAVLDFFGWYENGTFNVLELTGSDDGVFDYSTVRGTETATGAYSVVTLHFLVKASGHTDLKLEGSPFEQVVGPCIIDKDYNEWPFQVVRHGFFSNDGTPAPPPP